MKILHIANFYGPKSGGIKTTIHDLGKRYEEAGHEFTFVVPGINLSKTKTPYGTALYLPSIEIPFSGGYRIFRRRREIKQAIVVMKPDRIECSDRFTLLFIGPFARRMGIQTLVFSHETLTGLFSKFLPAPKTFQRLADWHNRRLAKAFDYVIATTRFASREFERLSTRNLRLIPLGVDSNTFNPKRYKSELRKKLLNGKEHLIIHCGRLSPEKDPHLSIEALEILTRQMGVSAQLVVIGGGPLSEKLKGNSAHLPVSFTGYIANVELIADIFSVADISLAPGPLETFCLSALESLSSGTPVVANSRSAVGEFLGEKSRNPCGATASDSYEFALKIKAILEGKSLRKAARAKALEFTWEKTMNNLLTLDNNPKVEVAQAA